MGQSVQQGGGHGRVAEDLRPVGKAKVRKNGERKNGKGRTVSGKGVRKGDRQIMIDELCVLEVVLEDVTHVN